MDKNIMTRTEQELQQIEATAVEEGARLLRLAVAQQAIIDDVKGERARRTNELRRCKTPEEFAAKGFVFEVECLSAAWDSRIKLGLPTSAPIAAVGDWVYDWMSKSNVQLVAVTWDGRLGCRGWRYGVPGTDVDGVPCLHANAPYVYHQETAPGSHCWARLGPNQVNA